MSDQSGTEHRNDSNDHDQPLVLSSSSHLALLEDDERDQVDKIELILASQSPRRREILDMMGLKGRYKVQVSPLNEASLQKQLTKDNPISYTQTLANAKARAVMETSSFSERPTIVLASDTIVAFQDMILEKPKSRQDAIGMLTKLSGQSHVVHTAVCIMIQNGEHQNTSSSFVQTAQVQFARLSNADIVAYVDTGDPMDKAGSYGIQGLGGQIVESINGDFFTVMGLPMHRTSQALAKAIRDVRKTP